MGETAGDELFSTETEGLDEAKSPEVVRLRRGRYVRDRDQAGSQANR